MKKSQVLVRTTQAAALAAILGFATSACASSPQVQATDAGAGGNKASEVDSPAKPETVVTTFDSNFISNWQTNSAEFDEQLFDTYPHLAGWALSVPDNNGNSHVTVSSTAASTTGDEDAIAEFIETNIANADVEFEWEYGVQPTLN